MKLRKSIAIMLAAAMMTGSAGTVYAAGAYSEAEKAAAGAAVEQFAAMYQESLAQAEPVLNGEQAVIADMKLELGETTRAMLGMAVSMDIGWFSNIGMKYNVSTNGLRQYIDGALYVNETDVCTIKMYMDYETMDIYYYVPEIIPYYLKISLADAYDEETAAALAMTKSIMENPLALYPDAEMMQSLLDRYFTLAFDAFQDAASSETTLNVNGVEQAAVQYEGRMYEEDAYELAKTVLPILRDDEQIQGLIETWAEVVSPGSGSQIYAELQSEIDGLIGELAEEEILATDAQDYISSFIWTNEEGEIIGRSIGMADDGELHALLGYQEVQNGADSALMITLNADDMIVSLEGNGTMTDGKLSGTYGVLVDGVKAATITVADYDAAVMEETGKWNGSYIVKLEPGLVDDESYEMLTAFELSFSSKTDVETSAGEIVLGLNTSGMPLGTLTVTAEYADSEGMPDPATFEPALDLMSDEDMQVLAEGLDWTPLKNNCISAGIPEELVTMVETAILSEISGEEVYE